MKTIISMSATHDRSKPRGVDMGKIKLGDTLKGEDLAVALNKGVAKLKGRTITIDKLGAGGSRRVVTLSKAELFAILSLYKK